jgi:hypothetical protein
MISRKTNVGSKVRTSDIPLDRIERVSLPNDAIENQVDELRKLGEAVHASDRCARTTIYEALAGAARFHVANSFRRDELRGFYRDSGIRPPNEHAAIHLQLLPIIKLILGLRDDVRKGLRSQPETRERRRLQKQGSDYAMALAFALSKGADPSDIVAFFDRPAMGIVEAASRYRGARQEHGAKRPATDPLAFLRKDPPIASFALDVLPLAINGPVALILERNDAAWVVRAAVGELPAIRRLMGSVKKTPEARVRGG